MLTTLDPPVPATASMPQPAAAAVTRRLRWAAPALVYVSGQALALLVVGLVADARHRPFTALLWSWDGAHFLDIAKLGYATSVASGVSNSIAFFPGYPVAVRAVHEATGLGFLAAALALSAGCGIATSYGLVRLVGVLHRDRVDTARLGLILVALMSTGPLSVVFAMAYSEALFCAVAVWALVLIVERRWAGAALLVVAAGLVRQTALGLVLALAVAVLLAARRGEAGRRAWVALLIAPCGALGYLLWADQHTGVHRAWFAAETNGWGARFDFGRATWRWAEQALTSAPAVLDVATVAVLIVSIGLLCGAIRRSPAVWAYSATVVASDVLSAGVMNSKVRLLVPAVTLLVPVAVAIADLPPRRRAVMIAAWAALGCWYSAYGLVIYGYAI